MNEFMFEFKNSLSTPLCDEIIEFYENEEIKFPGRTMGGVNKKVKDTTDFIIPFNDMKWKNIEKALYKELLIKLKLYFTNISKDYLYEAGLTYTEYYEKTFTPTFMIQKYDKDIGKYTYHVDEEYKCNSHRIVTFIWYLNTVDEGGETEFWGNKRIKPEKGKLFLFPSNWCFPHTGKVPLSDNKYIITGWIYSKNENTK